MSRLLVASLEPWDQVWRRNQYLIDGLLRGDPGLEVLFVEPPVDPLHAVRSGRAPRTGRGLRTAEGYGGRLRLFEPTKALPRRAGRIADDLLFGAVRRALERIGWRDGLLWINDPTAAPLLDLLGWPVVYDMTDDWTAAARSPREHARIVAGDDALLRRADAVIVCSTGLQRSRGDVREVHLIPNAVDVERYRRPAARPADMPAEPVALYAGTLHEDRLDVDLVLRTADALPGGRVLLVGPDALAPANSARLVEHPRIDLTGPRARDEMPGYLQHAHVLLVPHVVDEFTESLDPIKLYEYRAVGRPVVSTPVAGFRGADGVVVVDASGFPAEAARHTGAWEPAALADVPDWSDRVTAVRSVVEPLLVGRPA
jgi:teichuronic acid biosynthesis glycosyltransferase TuaH